MLKSVRHMRNLWFQNRKWFRKTPFSIPQFEIRNARNSFMAYAAREQKSLLPKEDSAKLTDEQLARIFIKNFPGRRVYHYDHQMKGGEVVENTKVLTLPRKPPKHKGSWWTHKGKVRKEIRDALLIKPSKTALLKGMVPFPVGHRPQKYYPTDHRFLQWLRTQRSDFLLGHNDHIDRIEIAGAWPTQWRTFQVLCNPVEHKVKYSDYDEAIQARGHLLKLPSLSPPTLNHVYAVSTNGKGGTGLLSTRLFGSTHEVADSYIKPLAAELFVLTGQKPTADISLWSIGGRAREQKRWSDKPLRSRLVIMPEGPPKVFGLTYAQPVYDALGIINWYDPTNEIKLGMPEYHGKYLEHSKEWDNEDLIIEYDISEHDSNTIEESIITAFGVLRSCFPPSQQIDNHFLYFMSGLTFKNIVIPGRFVYKVLKGIPSGTPFTSLIVSIVNWLNASSFLTVKFGHELSAQQKLAVYGDDTKIALRGEEVVNDVRVYDEKFWIDGIKEHTGHILDPVHIRTGKWVNELDAPTFLKTYSWKGLPARHTHEVLVSAGTLGRNKVKTEELITRITGVCYTSAFNFASIDALFSYRRFLRYLLYMREGTGVTQKYWDKVIKQSDEVTFRSMSRVILMPIVLGFEAKKSIDFGNKVRVPQQLREVNEEWIASIAASPLFSIDMKRALRATVNLLSC